MFKMTKDRAAQVRAVLEVAAVHVPPDDDTAAAGVELDALVAEALGVAPVMTRPWHRRAGVSTATGRPVRGPRIDTPEAPA